MNRDDHRVQMNFRIDFVELIVAPRHGTLRWMSPTLFKEKGYRFYFFSREENRIHIHVHCADGEAKFWIEPIPSLAESQNLSSKQLNKLQKIVEKHLDEIKHSWKKHFTI